LKILHCTVSAEVLLLEVFLIGGAGRPTRQCDGIVGALLGLLVFADCGSTDV
jgi:hypothetical protein